MSASITSRLHNNPHFVELISKWKLLAALFFAGFLAWGAGVYAFTLFLPSIEQEFGWGRALTGGAVSVFWLSAPILPLVGWAVDRYGPRLLVAGGLLIEGILFLFVFFISTVWQLYLIRIVMGAGKIMVFIATPATVAKNFRLCMGIATGVVLAGTHVGGLVMSSITQEAIDQFGWRVSAIIIGLIFIIIGIPIALRYLKSDTHSPQQLSLTDVEENTLMQQDMSDGMSVGQVFKTSSFWFICLVSMMYYYGLSAVLFQQTNYLTDMNLSPQAIAKCVGAIAAFAAGACLLVGPLIDKYGTIRSLMFCFILQGSAVVSLLCFNGEADLPFLLYFVVAFGIAVGACDVVWCVLIKEKFGTKNYGAIFGFWYLPVVAMLISGAIIAGFIYDKSGSYLMGFAPIPVGTVISILIFFAIFIRPINAEARH